MNVTVLSLSKMAASELYLITRNILFVTKYEMIIIIDKKEAFE